MQRNAETMLGELMASESVFGMEDNEAFVWNILHGLMEHEDEVYGGYGPMGHHHGSAAYADYFGLSEDEMDEEDEDYEDEDDEEDEDEDDDDFEDDDSDDEIPDLVGPDIFDDLPALVDDDSRDTDDDAMPELVDDDDVMPELVDDSDVMPELVDDSDAMPDLVDDSDDDLPDLINDTRNRPDPWTREDWGPNNSQNDETNHHPQVLLNGQRATSRSNIPSSHSGVAGAAINNNSRPQVRPTPRVSPGMFQRLEPRQCMPQLPRTMPSVSIVNPHGFTPASHLRRFSPPQHTPPPGPRRPRPPRSRNPERSRPSAGGTNPPPNIIYDELRWDDEDGANENSDVEISEREKQRIRESEERGINARNWDSRASDLSYFSR
jgi:hypothetical protein